MTKRLGWIDIAKGICLISVILGHLGVSQFGFVYSFHLTTFFILSGYTLRKKEISLYYLKNKFTRLMVPYFFTCTAVLIMDVINQVLVSHNFSTATITKTIYTDIARSFFASGTYKKFGNIAFDNHIGAIWFLPAMFFALIFMQFILNAFHSKKAQIAAAMVIALVGCISAPVIWLPFSIQAGMLAVPFILFGFYLNETELLERLKWWHYIIFLAVFVVGCVGGCAQVFYMVTCTMQDWLLTPLCALCSSLLVIGISKWINQCKVLEFVGKNSLIFLCVHLFEINTLSPYFTKFRELLHIPHHRLIHFVMEIIFTYIVSYLLVKLLGRKNNQMPTEYVNKRDFSLDILRSLMIVLMIVGHVRIDWGLTWIIYSIHMMAFVMVSGYFYREGIPILTHIKKTLKTLLPYLAFTILYIIVNQGNILTELKDIAMGISFTKNHFGWASSVGPVYFILLLFVVKCLYICIDQCKKEWIKHGLVLSFFILGVLLGKYGMWLPWSIDCALFSLLFYHIAHYTRKWDILNVCKNMPYLYFPLSCVWAFMIYYGSMELAMRRYNNLGLTIAGVLAAFILLYLLCDSLANRLPLTVCKGISIIGQSTAHILVLHTIFGNEISLFAANVLSLNSQNIFHLIAIVIIQVGLGVVSFLLFQGVKRLLGKLYACRINSGSAAL